MSEHQPDKHETAREYHRAKQKARASKARLRRALDTLSRREQLDLAGLVWVNDKERAL